MAPVPVLVLVHRVRLLWQGADGQRDAHEAERAADSRHPGRMRHDGCRDRAGKAELLTGMEGVSSRPVRKIVLMDAPLAPGFEQLTAFPSWFSPSNATAAASRPRAELA